MRDEELRDEWRRFIAGGFELKDFTPAIYQYVFSQETDPGLLSLGREAFWQFHFASDLGRLRRFLSRWGDPAIAGTITDYQIRTDLAPLVGPFNETLDSLAHELYQAEKWAILSGVGSVFSTDPARLIHWSQRYDEHYPFEESAGYLNVTPKVRDFLSRTAKNTIARAIRRPVTFQATIFEAVPPTPVAAEQPDQTARFFRLGNTQPERKLFNDPQEKLKLALGG